MTGQRRGYVVALVVAVLALVVSLGAALTVMTTNDGWHLNNAAQAAGPDGWRQGLAGNGMMGQGRGVRGMMGDWKDQGTPRITTDQARTAAEAWAAANQPGGTVGAVVPLPMGYLFTVTKDGQNVGTVIVNDDTGQVAWWGAAQPTPTTSDS
jgi:hypothetical protein